MGGDIDWSALQIVADLIGIEDIEALLMQLVVIRDWKRNNPTESD